MQIVDKSIAKGVQVNRLLRINEPSEPLTRNFQLFSVISVIYNCYYVLLSMI